MSTSRHHCLYIYASKRADRWRRVAHHVQAELVGVARPVSPSAWSRVSRTSGHGHRAAVDEHTCRHGSSASRQVDVGAESNRTIWRGACRRIPNGSASPGDLVTAVVVVIEPRLSYAQERVTAAPPRRVATIATPCSHSSLVGRPHPLMSRHASLVFLPTRSASFALMRTRHGNNYRDHYYSTEEKVGRMTGEQMVYGCFLETPPIILQAFSHHRRCWGRQQRPY